MFSFGRKAEEKVVFPSTDGIVRRRMVFHGRVQGVGFRYRSVYAARDLGLTGWVRNEYDGTVLMEAQGEPEKINALLKVLRYQRYIRIERVDSEDIPVDVGERSFRERY